MADRSSASTTELEVRDRAIVERVAAGLSLRAVGAEYGLSYKVVGTIAARAGVRSSRRRGPPPLAGAPHRRTPAVAQRGPVHGVDRATARSEQDDGVQADRLA
jgi:transposase